MVKRWLWIPGLVAAIVLLAAVVAPRVASARSVNMVVGCNPVALTYNNGTAVTMVGDGVAPTGSLTAIWKYLPAESRWIGYSAGAPAEVSDLQTVQRLDAVFVCVNAVATITMPDIGG